VSDAFSRVDDARLVKAALLQQLYIALGRSLCACLQGQYPRQAELPASPMSRSSTSCQQQATWNGPAIARQVASVLPPQFDIHCIHNVLTCQAALVSAPAGLFQDFKPSNENFINQQVGMRHLMKSGSGTIVGA
jgi:hypothetical protein